jgi:V/A-type H+-transporting ATPase subunit D
LDRKLRVLRSERARLAAEDAVAEQRWTEAYAHAQQWLRRTAMLGGERAIRLAAADPATVRLSWPRLMGVRYPTMEQVVPASASPSLHPPGTAALPFTAAAYAAALDAAVRRAAAAAALAAVTAEAARTAQRWHAVNDRWIPRLEAAGNAVARRMDEAERDEIIRLRWASARPGTSRKDTN